MGDLLGRIAERPEDLVGVLAAPRGRAADLARRLGERERLSDEADAAELRVLDRRDDPNVLHLRIREHLVHTIDRPRREAAGLEPLEPLLSCTMARDLRDIAARQRRPTDTTE